jgi:hypothetical protein
VCVTCVREKEKDVSGREDMVVSNLPRFAAWMEGDGVGPGGYDSQCKDIKGI